MAGWDPGMLVVASVLLPVAGLLVAVPAGARHARSIVIALVPVGLAIAVAITIAVLRSGEPLIHVLGGWSPPLGIVLRADGLAAAMLLTTAVVIAAVVVFARDAFATGTDGREQRAPFAFWTLLLGLWAGLNAAFVGNDLFNLFVALEVLTFAAVPLVALDGSAATLAAALRYLVFALLGSVLFLLGVALIYGAHGTLDLGILAARRPTDEASAIAVALMTAGLAAKTALFPLHLWLPPAHAGAPPAASAMLSALVVKASFVITVRLWFDLMPWLRGTAASQVMGLAGAGAILAGSVLALRQERLKLLVAYSTVAQIGYLFLMFPLASGIATLAGAWTGGMLQMVSHALAKAAMFMATGLIAEARGHDRIEALGRIARARPVAVAAFALAGFSLMGLPPSGGFAAKWLLLRAAVETGQWWWAMVIAIGGLFTGAYLFRVLAASLGQPQEEHKPATTWPRASGREGAVLILALASIALGFVPLGAFGLVLIGRAG